MTRKNKLWTKREYTFIVDNYGKLTAEQMAQALGRTKGTVRMACMELRAAGIYLARPTNAEKHRVIIAEFKQDRQRTEMERARLPRGAKKASLWQTIWRGFKRSIGSRSSRVSW